MKIFASCEESGYDACEEILAKSVAILLLAKRFLRRVGQYCFLRRDSCEELLAKSGIILLLAKRFLRRVSQYCYFRRDSCEEILAKRLVFLSRFRCAYYADCLIAILY